jgi:DNA-binding Xre family transcriptional regulator
MLEDPQIIKTPAGEELVVLSRGNYDALLHALAEAEEELADIAASEIARAEMVANPVPNLPAEVSAYILKGSNRLSAILLWRKLDAKQLAERTGLSEDELRLITGRKQTIRLADVPTVAKALDVPEAWIEP